MRRSQGKIPSLSLDQESVERLLFFAARSRTCGISSLLELLPVLTLIDYKMLKFNMMVWRMINASVLSSQILLLCHPVSLLLSD
ncbi:unnamed protein product [Eruca vesicaria subsp. sativa]|uniref:Uncharacterized protein n=1 Tax=Eruca vesicaria subsp. sativa TaxID=29727 RepID=A0ABC8JL75_ERUVS|nr:unnamed protein product [Eruca vesicaria subsp. sativa]